MSSRFLQNKDKTMMATLCLCGLLVAGLLLWASWFQINDFVRGQGKIIPSGKSRIIQHREGGIIVDLNKTEGSIVREGEVILSIDNTDAQSSYDEMLIEQQAYDMRIFRLNAELEGKAQLDFPQTMADEFPEIAETERALFDSRQQNLNEKLAALNEQITQKKHRISELQSLADHLKKELQVAEKQNDIIVTLNKSGAASESRVLDSQSQIQNFKTRIDEAFKKIPQHQSEIKELQSRISEIKEENKSKIFEDLNRIQLDKRKLSERMKSSSQALSRTDLISPIDGVIKNLRFNTLGGVIKPGDVIAEITPKNEGLIVEARIAVNDRDSVWMEQPARVKISAYDTQNYGVIDGFVSEISPDTLIDDKGNSYYRIKIGIDDKSIDKRMELYPGMAAEVNIISGKRSIISFLFRPVRYMVDGAFGV